jgi:hypothetical protein
VASVYIRRAANCSAPAAILDEVPRHSIAFFRGWRRFAASPEEASQKFSLNVA